MDRGVTTGKYCPVVENTRWPAVCWAVPNYETGPTQHMPATPQEEKPRRGISKLQWKPALPDLLSLVMEATTEIAQESVVSSRFELNCWGVCQYLASLTHHAGPWPQGPT